MENFRANNRLQRRRGPDFLIRLMEALGVFGWLLMFVALLVVGKAKPQVETFFDRHYHIALRTAWDESLIDYLCYVMLFGLCLSVSGLIINRKRHRRKGDEYRISLILVGIISLAGIAACLFFRP